MIGETERKIKNLKQQGVGGAPRIAAQRELDDARSLPPPPPCALSPELRPASAPSTVRLSKRCPFPATPLPPTHPHYYVRPGERAGLGGAGGGG